MAQAITENDLTEDDTNERSRCDESGARPKTTIKFLPLNTRI